MPTQTSLTWEHSRPRRPLCPTLPETDQDRARRVRER